MTVDSDVVPGLLILALELLALAAVGFVVARVALGQRYAPLALAQGLLIGPALWGLIANFIMFLLPGVAGAIAAWVVIVGIGAALAWRAPSELRLSARTAAVFVAAALALLWLALAGRQLLSLADDEIHLGLAASIRAGGYPPVIPWNPGQPAPYHYGVDMLFGLLAPPTGPDLAFVTELLGAYIWTGLALVAVTLILRYGGWVGVIGLSPLLLSAGAWTLIGSPNPPSILNVPVPTGLPTTGLRTALTEMYWPSFGLPLDTNLSASPPNSWTPSFPLAYALAFIVLERISSGRNRTWPSTVTLAALLGFVGLVEEAVALIGVALWIAFELAQTLRTLQTFRLLHTGRESTHSAQHRNDHWPSVLRAAAGPALTVLLLTASGGVVTGLLTGSSHSGLSLELIDNPSSRRPLGTIDHLAGGVGILGIGPFVVAAVAIVLAWRSPLVRMLAVGSCAFLAAALVLRYEPSPADITRMDGHARNFALLALLVALGLRLASLENRQRYVAALGLITLVTWPTAASPARSLSLALERGPQLSNMSPGPREFHAWFLGRQAVRPFRSDVVAEYIREHTPVYARVLSPHPSAMTIASGRPNASGYANMLHFLVGTGPEYKDAIRYLEPTAIRNLEIDYIHATDTWVASLPERAAHWLNDPGLFELLVRDGADALYRVQAAFLELNIPPAQGSFESLRRAVPESASVYLSHDIEPRDGIRAADALSHTQQFGEVRTSVLHLLTRLPLEPLGKQDPDLVVTSSRLAPSAFAPAMRRPIWWNDGLAVYAPTAAIKPIMDPPPSHFSANLSDVRMVDGRIAFTATFTDRATDLWSGQDWLVISADHSRWALPDKSTVARRTQAPARSFMGQLQPVPETEIHEYFYLYEFEPRTATLTLWDGTSYANLDQHSREFGPGEWILAVRLLSGSQEAALIPVLRFELAASGDHTYEVYEGSLNAMLLP